MPLHRNIRRAYLDETDGGRLFTEALTAEVESVLADETSLVGAESAGCIAEYRSPGQDLTGSPLPATLSELPGTREPNSVVGHFGEMKSKIQVSAVCCGEHDV